MATHFDPYPDDDETAQAPCGTWLGEASNGTSNWAHVNCGLCLRMKAKISAAHEVSEVAIIEQMGDMAAYMRFGTPMAKLEVANAQPSKFNPLEAGRAEPDFIVQLLEQFVGTKLSAEKKTSILTVISELPEGAGMRELYEAIMVQEAASLGVTVAQYKALSPVLEALQRILASGDHAALFE